MGGLVLILLASTIVCLENFDSLILDKQYCGDGIIFVTYNVRPPFDS